MPFSQGLQAAGADKRQLPALHFSVLRRDHCHWDPGPFRGLSPLSWQRPESKKSQRADAASGAQRSGQTQMKGCHPAKRFLERPGRALHERVGTKLPCTECHHVLGAGGCCSGALTIRWETKAGGWQEGWGEKDQEGSGLVTRQEAAELGYLCGNCGS